MIRSIEPSVLITTHPLEIMLKRISYGFLAAGAGEQI